MRSSRSSITTGSTPGWESTVNPQLLPHINEIVSTLRSQGYDIRVGETNRTPEQEAQKIAQGFSRVKNPNKGPHVGAVSNAVDLVVYENGKPDWSGRSPTWKLIGNEARKRGLGWGGDINGLWDPGHVQIGGSLAKKSASRAGVPVYGSQSDDGSQGVSDSLTDLFDPQSSQSSLSNIWGTSVPDVPVSTVSAPQVVKTKQQGKPRYVAVKTEVLQHITPKPGETLRDIAARYKTDPIELARLNGMGFGALDGTEQIRVPVQKTVLKPVLSLAARRAARGSYGGVAETVRTWTPKREVSLPDLKNADEQAIPAILHRNQVADSLKEMWGSYPTEGAIDIEIQAQRDIYQKNLERAKLLSGSLTKESPEQIASRMSQEEIGLRMYPKVAAEAAELARTGTGNQDEFLHRMPPQMRAAARAGLRVGGGLASMGASLLSLPAKAGDAWDYLVEKATGYRSDTLGPIQAQYQQLKQLGETAAATAAEDYQSQVKEQGKPSLLNDLMEGGLTAYGDIKGKFSLVSGLLARAGAVATPSRVLMLVNGIDNADKGTLRTVGAMADGYLHGKALEVAIGRLGVVKGSLATGAGTAGETYLKTNDPREALKEGSIMAGLGISDPESLRADLQTYRPSERNIARAQNLPVSEMMEASAKLPDKSKFPYTDMYTVDDKTGRVYQNGQPVNYIRTANGLLKETPLPGTSLVPTTGSPLGVKPTRFYAGEKGTVDPSTPVYRVDGENTRRLLPSEVLSLDPEKITYNENRKRYEYDPRVGVEDLFDKPDKYVSLSRFARKFGILADDVNSGEARRLSNKETGTTGIVRQNGISADRLAEKAWEEGYYNERPDPNQLLDDIEGDLSGRRKIYPTSNMPELDYEDEFRKAYPDEGRVADGVKALMTDPVAGKFYDLITEGKDQYGRSERLLRAAAGAKEIDPKDIDTIIEGAKRESGQNQQGVPSFAGSEAGERAGGEGGSLEGLFDVALRPIEAATPAEEQGAKQTYDEAQAEIDAVIQESKNQLEGDTSFNPAEFESRITPDLRGAIHGALETGKSLYKAGMSVKDFTSQMIKRLGEKIRPFIDSIYSKVRAFHEDERGFLGVGRGVLRRGNIAELSAPLNMALRKGASISGQVGTVRAAAWPLIDRILKPGGMTRADFTSALITNRLVGIRDAYNSLAADAQKLPPDQLEKAYTESYAPLLEELSDKAAFNAQVQRFGDLRTEGDHFLDEAKRTGDYSGLRDYLDKTFQTAKQAVEQMHLTPDKMQEFQRVTNSPTFKPALGSYKKNVESVMDVSHAENRGYFTSARGPLDTYYPLLPQVEKLDAQGQPTGVWENMKRASGLSPGVNAIAPRNISNYYATGMSPKYDETMEGFNQRLFRSLANNSKANAVRTLQDSGWGRLLQPKENVPEDFTGPNGLKYTVATIPTSGPRINNEQTVRQMIVPEFVKDKWEEVFPSSGSPTSPGRIKQVMNMMMHLTLATPTELTTHITNMAAITATGTGILPPARKSLVGSAVSDVMSNPITKAMYSVHRALSIEPSSEEMVQRQQWLADRGLIPDKYAQLTVSKKLAETTGAKLTRNPLNLGAVALYGPRGFDLRARLFLDKIFTDTYPNATESERVKFNQKLPNYVRALQGRFERAVKDSGLAPFYTAGSTVYKSGLKSVLPGQSLFEVPRSASVGKALSQSLQMELTGRATGLVALWAIGHVALTGKWPWEDKDSRFLQLPVPDSIRNSEIGQAIWGKGGNAYLDLSAFNPAVNRGVRATGLRKGYEVAMAGGSMGQVAEHAGVEAADTGANVVFTGPAPRFAFTALTGREPYSTSPRDDKGNFNPLANLYPAVNKEEPGWKTALSLLGSSVVGSNSVLGKAFEDSGVTFNSPQAQNERWLKTAISFMPFLKNAFTNYDPSMMSVRLAKERGLAEENVQSETRKGLIQKARTGEDVRGATGAAIQTGTLSSQDRKTIRREGKQTDLQSAFESLPAKDALDAYENLKPADQMQVRRLLIKKQMHLQNLPRAEQKVLRKRFNEVLKIQRQQRSG